MTDQKDLTPFERAMRIKLGLIKPHPKPELSRPEQQESEVPWRDRSPANAWFAEAHPGYTDEVLEKLAQEF